MTASCTAAAMMTKSGGSPSIPFFRRELTRWLLIGSSYAEDDEDSEKVEYIREAAKQVPVFMMNGCIRGENIYCALCNDFQAAHMAVTELIQTGKEDILFLSDSHSYSANQKLKGYQQATS